MTSTDGITWQSRSLSRFAARHITEEMIATGGMFAMASDDALN